MKVFLDDIFIRFNQEEASTFLPYLASYFSATYEDEETTYNELTEEEEVVTVMKTKYYMFSKDNEIYIYSGLKNRFFHFLKEVVPADMQVEVIDNRTNTRPLVDLGYEVSATLLEGITLREDYQLPVVKSILQTRRGIVFIPTRGGKTEILISAVRHYREYENPEGLVTVIVKKNTLATNFHKRFLKRGFHSAGKFYDGNKDFYSDILCCVVNSVYNVLKKEEEGNLTSRKDKEMFERIKNTDFFIVDEVQDATSEMFQYSFKRIMALKYPDLIISVSGTPFSDEFSPHSNIRDLNVIQLFGSVFAKVNDEFLIQKHYKARGNVFWMNYGTDGNSTFGAYHKVYKKVIVDNLHRNMKAFSCAKMLLENDISVLVLVNRIEHGKNFLKLFAGMKKNVVFTSSQEDFKLVGNQCRKVTDLSPVDDFNEGRIDALIGTNILNVGVDFPNCQFLIVLSGEGMDNDILNRQRTSRILCPNTVFNNNGYIIDFFDKYNTITEKHSYSRQELYSSSNYHQHFDDLDFIKAVNSKNK